MASDTGPTVAGVRARLLLAGSPASRPDGLERVLVRAGFEVAEGTGDPAADALQADLVLVNAPDEAAALAAVEAGVGGPGGARAPLVVALDRGEPAGVTRLLVAGASDVVVGPMDLNELCARLASRVRWGREAHRAARLTQQTSQLFDAYQEIALTLRPEETLHTLVRHLGQVFDLAHCAAVLWSPSDRPGPGEGRLVAVHESPRVRDVPVDLDRYPEVVEAVRRGATVVVTDVLGDALFAGLRARWRQSGTEPEVRHATAVPLLRQGQPIGAVVLRAGAAAVPGPESLRLAERLIRGTARLLEQQERRAAISRRHATPTVVDPLTRCGSLDALDKRITEEFSRARRYALSFSLVLLDVDGLAAINQRHGTEAGDRVLAELGAILQREIRAPDFVARYGGDEFALVMPETTLEGARRTIARLRSRVSGHPFADLPAEGRPELSAGVVTHPHPSALHPEDLFALAESALLRAKAEEAGGERIGVADPAAA